MILKGFKAIKYLEERYLNDDFSASSHWKKFHKKFTLKGMLKLRDIISLFYYFLKIL